MQYVVLPFLVVVVVDVDRYSLYLFVPLRRHLHCHCHCHRRRRHSTLIIDGREEQCSQYFSSGTGISEFYIMWINDVCCLRSSKQSNTECTNQYGDGHLGDVNKIPFQ